SYVSFKGRTDGGGCFAPLTRIRMADGSAKYAMQIEEGDMVRNPITGKAMLVGKVVGGPETKTMYRIQSFGREVVVTEGHPFMTLSGLKAAEHLAIGEQILQPSGSYEPITAIEHLTN